MTPLEPFLLFFQLRPLIRGQLTMLAPDRRLLLAQVEHVVEVLVEHFHQPLGHGVVQCRRRDAGAVRTGRAVEPDRAVVARLAVATLADEDERSEANVAPADSVAYVTRDGRDLRLADEFPALLVHAAALDHGPEPHEPDGASQSGIAVDDAEHGVRRPRATRSSMQPFHASKDSPPHSSSARSCLPPSARTPTTPSTGTLTTFPALRTRRRSASERVRHASRPSFSVATTRDTALFESGAALRSGWSALRIRRLLPPAKYVAITASLTSGIRR